MKNKGYMKIVVPIVSLLLAFLIGSIAIISVGQNPIVAYSYLFTGALGNIGSLGETLVKATPLIFTGLAATFAYRCNLFNLGAEGQFIMGSIGSVWFAINFGESLPPFISILISLLIGAICGGLWGFIPGLLKSFLSLNEMIITILLNYIATLFMSYLFSGPLMEANIPQTAAVPESLKLPKFLPGTRVHIGIFIAIILAIILYYFLFNTTAGFKLRAVGLNQEASLVNGFNVKKYMFFSFIISGAIAGLGGAIELHGAQFRLMAGYGEGFGFDGVAIALIGQLNPIGTVIVAFLFAILRTGANTMQIATGIPTTVVGIIQALVIIFVVAGTTLVNQGSISSFLKNRKRGEAKC